MRSAQFFGWRRATHPTPPSIRPGWCIWPPWLRSRPRNPVAAPRDAAILRNGLPSDARLDSAWDAGKANAAHPAGMWCVDSFSAMSDPARENASDASVHFDPRPRVGATLKSPQWCSRDVSFDPRPRVGATTSSTTPATCGTGFDPRPRVGATSARPGRGASPPGFDPRPRVGATGPSTAAGDLEAVSIRAPGWGRLVILNRKLGEAAVSIRAPGWGRLEHLQGRKAQVAVSIRAPGWGRRAPKRSAAPLSRSFDPRPRVGATARLGQGRHPAEVSIRAPGWGRHVRVQRLQEITDVSIRAPGWGRHDALIKAGLLAWFRSAPPGGGDWMNCTIRR